LRYPIKLLGVHGPDSRHNAAIQCSGHRRDARA